jgi:L-alanine-DL-glutamate epimerase-like enolase superfamily enzyme
MTGGSPRVAGVRVRGGTRAALSLVEVSTGDGVTGIGATGSPVQAIDAIVRGCGLAELVIGEDPLEPRRLWRRMFQTWQAQRGRGSEGGLAVNAMGAIDMAFWDLKGKLLDLPLYRLLGDTRGEDVPAYASATAFQDAATLKSPDRLAAESDAVVQRGFRALKFGWGAHVVQPDAAQMGVTQAFEVTVSAREHGMRCVPHGPWSALTVAAHLHILASAGGGMVEYPGFDALLEATAAPARIAQFEIVERPPELVDGRLRLPSRPGLGLGNFVDSGVRGLEADCRC